jgi:hypothetical protein
MIVLDLVDHLDELVLIAQQSPRDLIQLLANRAADPLLMNVGRNHAALPKPRSFRAATISLALIRGRTATALVSPIRPQTRNFFT